MPIRNLNVLTMIVTIMVVIDALWAPLVLSAASAAPIWFNATITPMAIGLDRSQQGFKVATFIVFGFWIYRAGENLIRADVDHLDYSPASRVWWFAVPVASVFKPYQAMRELWNAAPANGPMTPTRRSSRSGGRRGW